MLHMYHGMASEVGRREAGAGMKFGRAEEGGETSVAAELEIGMSKSETQGGDGDGLFRAARRLRNMSIADISTIDISGYERATDANRRDARSTRRIDHRLWCDVHGAPLEYSSTGLRRGYGSQASSE